MKTKKELKAERAIMAGGVRRFGSKGAPLLHVAEGPKKNTKQRRRVTVLYPRIVRIEKISSGGLPSLGKKR